MSADYDDPRVARAAWSRIAEPGDRAAGILIREVGPCAALTWLLSGARGEGLSVGGGLANAIGRWRPRLDNLDPRRELGVLHDLGGRLVIPEDDDWPSALDDLGEEAPICLWALGSAVRQAQGGGLSEPLSRAVAIVGSRASTNYGEVVTQEVVSGLVAHGVTIVSGGAFGIDAAAHRTALGASGATVAVMAGGVDRPYPLANTSLLTQVAESCALVSELPPFSAPRRERFLQRNRLIAAVSQAVVVVEAGWRSGAQNTARHAAALLRPVGAIPGPITSAASAGCHRLLREHAAVCVTDAGEILELLQGRDPAQPEAGEENARTGLLDDLPSVHRLVLDALPLKATARVDALAAAAGLPGREVLTALGALERQGLAERRGAEWRKAPGALSSRRADDGAAQSS